MILFVSGSIRSVGALAERWPNNLGHLITPKNRNSIASLLKTGLMWVVDNGAYSGFDHVAFRRLLVKCAGQPRLLWIVSPDVVGDARATVILWKEWSEEIRQTGPAAFVLQDGQEDLDLPQADTYFIGGSTGFKLSSQAADLAREVKSRSRWLHMGRVNSRRRMQSAHDIGCDSVDGSSASKFGDKYIHKYLLWMKQIHNQRSLF